MSEIIKTNVAGVSFENEDGIKRQVLIGQYAKPGMPIYLEREPQNPEDSNAVIVFLQTPDNQFYQLGYLPKKIALIIAHRMDNHEIVQGKVTKILNFEDGSKGIEVELMMRAVENKQPSQNLQKSQRNYSTITSDKSKKTALLLCIFGGYMGLHLFYVGRIGRGILYLFTGGLFVIGWIADMISIGAGSFRDSSGAPLRQ